MNKNKPLVLSLVYLLFAQWIFSQQERSISLQEVLEKVHGSNRSIRISGLDAAAAKADYQLGNAVFLPNIAISHTGFTTTNPLMAFGSKLNQELITEMDFNPALLNDPDHIDNFSTVVSVQQPLVNMDGLYKRKAALSTMKAKEFQFQRTKDYMAFEAENAFMQLQLAYKMAEVLEKAYAAAQANGKLTKDYYDQGLIQKADWLQAEVRTAEVDNQWQQAKSNIKNASDYLSFVMGTDQRLLYHPAQELLPKADETLAGEKSLEFRADVMAMQKVADAHKENYRADKMTFLPRLNAFGSYELYDDALFKADAKGYTIGASLSWDIFKGGQRFAQTKKGKANAEKAQLELEEYLSKSQMELDRTKRMLVDAKNRLKSSELALQQSEESLHIRTNRFKEGLEKTTELLLAETQYAQQELAYHQTVYEYNYALAYHTFLTKEIQ